MTRELPNNFPFIVVKSYIGEFVQFWDDPSQNFFTMARKELNARIESEVDRHFSRYTHGHLKQRITYAFCFLLADVLFYSHQIRSILKDHVQKCVDAGKQHIEYLLIEEQEPFTMNRQYFADYREKFYAYYRGARQRAKSNFIRNLKRNDDEDMMRAVNEAISSLVRLGIEGANATMLANLLPQDPMDPAIGIMADVRAYFQSP